MTLLADSPCIDTGDPDGTRADMGAFCFDQAVHALVINEINYNSAGDFDPQDWVELYNPGAVAVDLGGVAFRDEGHTFTIPTGTVLAAGGYLVLAEDVAAFQALFPGVDGVIGDLAFGFAGSGELLQLVSADGLLIDAVPYDDAAPWPVEPDGNGPTLELRDPALDNALGESWAASVGHGTPGAANSVVVGVPEGPAAMTTELRSVHPSPFNPRCTVAFSLERGGAVSIAVHDLLGRRVAMLVDEWRPAGRHQVVWLGVDDGGRAVASGTYLVRMRSVGGVEVRKVMLVR